MKQICKVKLSLEFEDFDVFSNLTLFSFHISQNDIGLMDYIFYF